MRFRPPFRGFSSSLPTALSRKQHRQRFRVRGGRSEDAGNVLLEEEVERREPGRGQFGAMHARVAADVGANSKGTSIVDANKQGNHEIRRSRVKRAVVVVELPSKTGLCLE